MSRVKSSWLIVNNNWFHEVHFWFRLIFLTAYLKIKLIPLII